MARMFEPINLNDLLTSGVILNVDSNHIRDRESESEDDGDDEESPEERAQRKLDQNNKECNGIFDEDDYQEGEPFERITKNMFNLVYDGRIKKRILREGEGEKPEKHARVKIHYNAYLEYADEPFDSSYIRKKPLRFTLDDGRVIAGLDFGVQSMKLNEKSQFMIHPDYGYGKGGSIDRIPPNATLLFEVELLEIVNCGAALTFEMLTDEQQVKFEETYKYCIALCEIGKKSFAECNWTAAVKNYNTAVCALNRAEIYNSEERNNKDELALKLHSNLLICNTRLGEWRKGCSNASKIYDLTANGELMKISAKVYFNHAKCLRMLCEYDSAKNILNKALKLEPRNPEIANEILNLEHDKLEHREKRMVFAKALVGHTD